MLTFVRREEEAKSFLCFIILHKIHFFKTIYVPPTKSQGLSTNRLHSKRLLQCNVRTTGYCIATGTAFEKYESEGEWLILPFFLSIHPDMFSCFQKWHTWLEEHLQSGRGYAFTSVRKSPLCSQEWAANDSLSKWNIAYGSNIVESLI